MLWGGQQLMGTKYNIDFGFEYRRLPSPYSNGFGSSNYQFPSINAVLEFLLIPQYCI